MRSRRWIAAVSLFSLVFAMSAQELPQLRETVEVSIVNVDVFVTDKSGRRIHGLTKDDFEIFENGAKQEITNFSEYASPAEVEQGIAKKAETAPEQRRIVALFIERVGLPKARAKEFVDSLRSLLWNTVRPGDAVSIMTWERYLKMRVPYTSDVSTLNATLDQIENELAGTQLDYYERFRRDAVEMTDFAADVARFNLSQIAADLRLVDQPTGGVVTAQLHANIAMIDMKRKVNAVNAIINSMAASDAKKILLLAVHRFPQYAGAEFFYAAGMAEPPAGVKNKLDATHIVDQMTANANAAGVTIYPLLPRGADDTAAIPDPGSNIAPDRRLGHDILLNDLVMTNHVAERTGGLTAWGTTDIAGLLPRIEDDVTDYYSLAYRTRTTKQDRTRDVVVKAKNREHVIRSRRQFVEKSDTSRMRERVLATLFGVTEPPTFVIAAQAKRQPATGGRKTVPVKVRIPIKSLTLLEQSGHHVGRFSVFVATGAPLGDTSEITHRIQPVQIAAKDLKRAQASYYTYSIDVEVDDRADRVAVGVQDEVSKDFALIRVPIRTEEVAARR
jgi:VWFA-related protein